MDDSRIIRRSGAGEPGQLLRFRQAGDLHGSPDGGDAGAAPDGASTELSGSELSAAELFGILWRGLADILGTAAAAALLRRAAQRALPRWPELAALCILRERLEYRYTLPSNWKSPVPKLPGALSALARELWPLLIDLTGSVVVQRLAQIPELREQGILPPAEVPP
ncbi:MAG: hypothetical protein ABI895_42245 [Deltaproteobacteria bacterium]